MDSLVSVYADMISYCMPFCVVFGFGNIVVSTILRAVFGGRLVIK